MMILNKCNFFSRTLCSHADVDILLPSMPDNDCLAAPLDQVYSVPERFPVLYLLHGAPDDHTCWLRHMGIEQYAEAAAGRITSSQGRPWAGTVRRNVRSAPDKYKAFGDLSGAVDPVKLEPKM